MRTLAFLILGVSAGIAAEPPTRTVPVQTQRDVMVEFTEEVPGVGIVKKTSIKLVPVASTKTYQPSKSALILCDVWDDHWCKAAATRCDTLAKKMADVVDDARKQGFTIIHCPSDTMDFYKDHPARKRALDAPKVEAPKAQKLPDPKLPIDDSDGGCDDANPVKPFKAWTCQHKAINIDGEKDYITDNGQEAFNIIQDRKITTVFVMGVHTNMCVLNRSFAIKQLRRWNVDCLLVRDLTDAMYNPKMAPMVTHTEGTNLVISHIERHWCPSILSTELHSKKK